MPTVHSHGAQLSRARDPEPVVVLACPDAELARILQRHIDGYRIELACDLVEAQQCAEEEKAIAILTDLDTPLPSTDGRVPVIRCPLPSVKQLARRLGVDDYLIKPISRENLVSTIQSLGRPIERVLIVDDVPWFAELLSRMLGADGSRYQVAIAHNGDEALEHMRLVRPDLLLLDLAMPGLDGAGVLERMAADASLKNVAVMIISAHAEGESNAPLGDEIWIHKPEGFRLAELTRVLGAMLREMSPVRAHVETTAPAPLTTLTG